MQRLYAIDGRIFLVIVRNSSYPCFNRCNICIFNPVTLYRNKYRIESARLSGWDYRNPGGYFVTICTRERECYFGDIRKDRMVLNNLGNYARHCWEQIPVHFPCAALDQFVIMPNHIHGIVVLRTKDYSPVVRSGLKNDGSFKWQVMSDISPLSRSLAALIRSFKSAVTRWANEQQISFAWQTRFHDHIIRDEQEWRRIADYIQNNPHNWKKDKFYNRSKSPGL